MRLLLLPALAILVLPLPAVAQTGEVPTEVGQCVNTSILEITTRLEGVEDSGDAVVYANGIYGVDYDAVEGLRNSNVGDPVELCLTGLPEDCPPDDDRGKLYSATNLNTHDSWELPDAEHMCGGA